jgi:hypothetical protein
MAPTGAQYQGGVALQAAQLGALRRRALERGAELFLSHGQNVTRELTRILPAIASRGANSATFNSGAKRVFHG